MPDLHLELPDLSYVDLHGLAPAVSAVWRRRRQSVSAGGRSRGISCDNQYDQARNLIEQNQYERAIVGFDRVITRQRQSGGGGDVLEGLQPGPRRPPARCADDARRAASSSSPRAPGSRMRRRSQLELRQASGQSVSADAQGDDELKLLALRGLMQSDPESALPVIEKMLNGPSSVRVKDRALFVVSQSRSTRGRDADRRRRQGQQQPRSAAEGDPLHRTDGRSRGVADAGRGLPRDRRRARQARDHPRARATPTLASACWPWPRARRRPNCAAMPCGRWAT